MKAKILFLLFIFIVTAASTGCWSSRQLEEYALAKGVGVDVTENGRVLLTVQLYKPAGGGEGQQQGGGQGGQGNEVWTVSATGFSIFDAQRNLLKRTGRKLFYGHNEILIYGEELARKGIGPYLDFAGREQEFLYRTDIAVAKGRAHDFLKAPYGFGGVPARGIQGIIDGRVATGMIFTTDIRKFMMAYLSPTREAVASRIELRKGGPQEGGSPGQNNLIYGSGGAMFKGDRLVDWLTRRETRGLNWVLDPLSIRGPVMVEIPEGKGKIAIEVIRVVTQVVPKRAEGEFEVVIKAKVEGNVAEMVGFTRYDFTKPENIRRLNKRFAQVVCNEIGSALKKSKKYRADVFGLGEVIYRKYPREFLKIRDEWDKHYAALPVTIQAEADIRSLGMITKGVN